MQTRHSQVSDDTFGAYQVGPRWQCVDLPPATLGRMQTVIIRPTAACVMLALIAMPAHAANRASAKELAECKALAENVGTLIRAGQTVITTRSQLRRCARIQRAERRREEREQARPDAGPQRP
jgi:hypothetical protein